MAFDTGLQVAQEAPIQIPGPDTKEKKAADGEDRSLHSFKVFGFSLRAFWVYVCLSCAVAILIAIGVGIGVGIGTRQPSA